MEKERRRALGIFLAVMALACNYSPLLQGAALPAAARADVEASAGAQAGRLLIPGGQAVGVALRTQGVLVVAKAEKGDAKTPLRVGDVIESVEGQTVTSAAELSQKIGAWREERVELGICGTAGG